MPRPDDWQLSTLAVAIARISTYTAREACDELKSALCALEDAEGACAKAFKAKLDTDEARYIVASDLAKLRIARAAVADTIPEHWDESPSYFERANRVCRRVNALTFLDSLIADAENIVGEQLRDD